MDESAQRKPNDSLNREKTVFKLLSAVFSQKAYSSRILNKALEKIDDEKEKAYITRLFYGVLDKSIQFDFILDRLCKTAPKTSIKIILKIGLFLLRFSDTPDFAVVSKTVDLAKALGKGGTAGFINAVLKNSTQISIPKITDVETLSINSSFPLWYVKMLVDDYSLDFCTKLLMHGLSTDTHIRHNGFRLTQAEFEQKYPFLKERKSDFGYFVTNRSLSRLDKLSFVIQSKSSINVTQQYFKSVCENINQNDKKQAIKILDLCSAPGGKSIYLKQLFFENDIDAQILACDIHSHRVELIKGYAKRCGCEIDTIINDACILREDFKEQFDLVICDVPCSGSGVTSSKPEILFFKSNEDIESLTKIQSKILSVAGNYVKRGGILCYSTCSVLKQENDNITEGFLSSNHLFSLLCNPLRLFMHIDESDGFYLSIFKKV